jgi:CheY-like chemotaxis protein
MRILWADDQVDFVDAHRDVLAGFDVHHVSDGEAAVTALQHVLPDLILLDLQMPPGELGGLWFLKHVPTIVHDVPVIMVSGRGHMSECIQALRLGACDYIEKEKLRTELRSRLDKALLDASSKQSSTDYARLRAIEQGVHAIVVMILEAATARDGHGALAFAMPRAIALKTYERAWEQRSVQQAEFLDLLDLADIIDKEWATPYGKTLESVVKPKNKDERTRWLRALNEARKVVAHPVRGGLSDEHRRAIASAEAVLDAWRKAL